MSREFILHIFEASGKTKKQFAAEISVNHNTLDKWLRGSFKPSAACQVRIREKFKKEIAKLYK